MISLFAWSSASASTLKIGQPAPEFDLTDQNGKAHTIAQYRNQWLVLYFYPKDDTPGCTTEACNFRDDYLQLKKLNTQVLGISIDNNQSHAEFASKYHLPFPLLADTQGSVALAYDALFELGPMKFAKRHTFIINPQGNIARVYTKVDPASHSDEIIQAVKQLQTN